MSIAHYKIAGLRIALCAPHFTLRSLTTFACDEHDEAPCVLTLKPSAELRQADDQMRLLDRFPFPDAGATCRLYAYEGGYLFVMKVEESGHEVRFDLPDGAIATTNFGPEDDPSLFRFGLCPTG